MENIKPFSFNELDIAVVAIGNQLAAGISLHEAVRRMTKLQPVRQEFWLAVADQVGRGQRLSQILEGTWPPHYVVALKAGETSGQVDGVFIHIRRTMEVQRRVKEAYKQLIQPVVSLIAGIGVFLFFMAAVIPKIAKGLGNGETPNNPIFALSAVIHQLLTEHWMLTLGASLGGFIGLYAWLTTPEMKEQLLAFANDVPGLGPAYKSLNFGLWGYTLAMLDEAGLPIRQQLLASVATLPEIYRSGVMLVAAEVERRGRSDAVDPEKQPEGDPRREWPYFMSVAFMTAHETGSLSKETMRVAPILIDEGVVKLKKFVGVADLITKAIAAVLIGLPMAAYFQQMSVILTKAFST